MFHVEHHKVTSQANENTGRWRFTLPEGATRRATSQAKDDVPQCGTKNITAPAEPNHDSYPASNLSFGTEPKKYSKCFGGERSNCLRFFVEPARRIRVFHRAATTLQPDVNDTSILPEAQLPDSVFSGCKVEPAFPDFVTSPKNCAPRGLAGTACAPHAPQGERLLHS